MSSYGRDAIVALPPSLCAHALARVPCASRCSLTPPHRSACPKDDPAYASQQTLFDDLGRDLLEHAFEGYNTTVFACE